METFSKYVVIIDKGEELDPAKPIIMAQYIGLAAVSVIVLLVALLA